MNNSEFEIFYDYIFKGSLRLKIITNRILWEIKEIVFIFELNKKIFYFSYSLSQKSDSLDLKNIKFENLWSKNAEEDFLILKNWIE